MKTSATETIWNAIPCIHECLHMCMLTHTHTHTHTHAYNLFLKAFLFIFWWIKERNNAVEDVWLLTVLSVWYSRFLYHFFSFPEIEQVDSGVNVSDLFSEGAQFDSCPGHLSPWDFKIGPELLPSTPFLCHYSLPSYHLTLCLVRCWQYH